LDWSRIMHLPSIQNQKSKIQNRTTKDIFMSSSTAGTHSPHRTDVERDNELQQIREALIGLRFGSVTIVVQDGVVVQIDRTEKKRLQRRNNAASETACT
jgi:hypothetical protein